MPNRVFLSYRHESENFAHRQRVRDFAERLRQDGLEVVLDQLAQEGEFRGGGPNEGWPQWSISQAESLEHKVLIVASTGWFRCYEGKEVPGSGLGVAAEASVIKQRLYNQAGVNPDFRIVTFESLDPRTIPLYLQRYHCFRDPEDFCDLARWLKDKVPDVEPPADHADWPASPPSLLWPVANHTAVRAAFEHLLTRKAPGRYLPLKGPTEAGKSHLTRQMLGNALEIPGLACGRFDFKGGINRDLELSFFVQSLEVSMPTASTLSLRLSQILEALRRRARPALLIFDTYEGSGEAQDWVEQQLLPSLIRSVWLRVVIAGQDVPPSVGSPWASAACAPIRLAAPRAEEWFDYSRLYDKPGVTLDFVRQAHECCGGKASVLAQLLGPSWQ